MNRRRPLAALWVALAVAGCAPDGDGASSTEDEVRASCAEPERYVAVLRDGTCEPVETKAGTWVPSPAFADAPPDSGACLYTWSSDGAPPDGDALRNYVGWGEALTPSCGPEDVVADPDVVEIASLTPGASAGAIGCDVCGVQQDGKVWVVLPPEIIFQHEFAVPLTNGHLRAFKFTAPEGLRLVTLTLPPAPEGTQYVDGRVQVQ